MKADAAYIEQVRKEASWATAEALKRMGASVMTGYHTEHEADDRHSIIHATGGIFERKRTGTDRAMGEWYDVPFVPGNFTGFTTMTWTVTASGYVTFAYTLIGMTMILAFDLRSTTVAGVPTAAFQIMIPDGWYARKTLRTPCFLVDNGVNSTGYVVSTANSNILFVFRTDNAAMTASAANTNVQGEISFPVRTA